MNKEKIKLSSYFYAKGNLVNSLICTSFITIGLVIAFYSLILSLIYIGCFTLANLASSISYSNKNKLSTKELKLLQEESK